jgi:hypothetical protein
MSELRPTSPDDLAYHVPVINPDTKRWGPLGGVCTNWDAGFGCLGHTLRAEPSRKEEAA